MIKILKELLLEKMHRTEECDQLLLDNDSVHNLVDHHQSYERMRDSQSVDIQFDSSLSKHALKFAHRPTSLSLHQNSHIRRNSDTCCIIFFISFGLIIALSCFKLLVILALTF